MAGPRTAVAVGSISAVIAAAVALRHSGARNAGSTQPACGRSAP
jgi:hypothetical protein